MLPMDQLPDFDTFTFTHVDRERTVYRKGDGPRISGFVQSLTTRRCECET